MAAITDALTMNQRKEVAMVWFMKGLPALVALAAWIADYQASLAARRQAATVAITVEAQERSLR